MRCAGLRNAIFDCTFFGVEHGIRARYDVPHAVSFALAAATAICMDYPVDVAVKRSMAQPCQALVHHGPVVATIRILRTEGFRVFRGLSCKGADLQRPIL
jgi:hypothetical protein